MKPLQIVKLSVDMLKTVLYIAMMGIGLMKSSYHEILGILLFTLFVVHHLLDLNWYLSLQKGKWTTTRIILIFRTSIIQRLLQKS